MDPRTELFLNFGLPLILLITAYFIGTAVEQRHYRRLRIRESLSKNFIAVTFPYYPEDRKILAAELVTGNVVVSVDYFKRFLAGLKGFFGGRITSYETLLDRARREAIMRLKETARDRGYNAVINIRLETSRLANSKRGGKGTAGVEILAFGTAIKIAR